MKDNETTCWWWQCGNNMSGLGCENVVRMSPSDVHALVSAYRRSANLVGSAGVGLAPWVREAADLLGGLARVAPSELEGLSIELAYEADHISWRVGFLEATDGFDLATTALRSRIALDGWADVPARRVEFEAIAVLLAKAETAAELDALVSWMWDGEALFSFDPMRERPIVPAEFRQLVAGSLVVAYEGGWRPAGGVIPGWLAAAMMTHGDPSDAAVVALAGAALADDRALRNDPIIPNPFMLDNDGAFAPFADRLVVDPPLARRFLRTLFDEHRNTGDTLLNMHDSHDTTEQLASVVLVAGMVGPVAERGDFVDELVTVINNDGDTSSAVSWATWQVHAGLVLEHGIETTEPTFNTHALVPDNIRPTWERTWNEHVSPTALNLVLDTFEHTVTIAGVASDIGKGPSWMLWDWATSGEPPLTRGNDAGGTYSTRQQADFAGMRFHFDPATQGRNIITHALHEASPEGDIAQDEFAIISHGTGNNGRPTYTVTLPGVIDLSSPHRGWNDTHRSVRDFDMAALASAPTARVEDNLYAQMVKRALQANGIERGSNLMLVGHSFGADTAADLAADQEFTENFNVTHVVAAAYDSVPQLAHISPDIDVLVLQNEDDKAILMESTQRKSSAAFDSISVNTFAHDIRVFDGGFSDDIGHHPRRYIDYLDRTDDDALTSFFESVADVGYAKPGSAAAIDVTLDESLLS